MIERSRTLPVDPVRRVTRDDVARYAGVSAAVVSYVVNGGPRPVADETAARVQAAIELLGYRPNISARALKLGRTHTLGLVLGDLENPFFTELGLKIQAAAKRAGYAVLISANGRERRPASHRVLIEDLIDRQVDGFLLDSGSATAEALEHLHRNKSRVVIFDAPLPVPGHATVGCDAFEGARLVVDHLISNHGHREVGLVIGTDGRTSADERERGWHLALRSADILDGPVVRAPFSREGGYEAARRMLATAKPPSAIFASSDLQAVGVLRAIREAGLRTPDDIAVVAFDGTAEAEYAHPALTVARQPVDEIAEAAVRQLLLPTEVHQTFPTTLVVRESCGCTQSR